MALPVSPELSVVTGLTLGSLVLSWLTTLATGSFKAGRLERRVELTIDRAGLQDFLTTLHQRLGVVGFKPGTVAGQFVQGGAGGDPVTGWTHAKTRKELVIAVDEQGGPASVELTLRYLEMIVGDSGESAYRDAVLDYVSGKADRMNVVPNRSFAATTSLVGGVCAWMALIGLKAVGYQPVPPPVVAMGVAYILTGGLAVFSINQNPAEVSGRGLAIAGIVLGTTAALCALLLGR